METNRKLEIKMKIPNLILCDLFFIGFALQDFTEIKIKLVYIFLSAAVGVEI
jgi:hypothetical protein